MKTKEKKEKKNELLEAPQQLTCCLGCRDCLEVHARAHMKVDAATIQEMLMDLLPSVLSGASVRSLAQPWPSASRNQVNETGLWWDK